MRKRCKIIIPLLVCLFLNACGKSEQKNELVKALLSEMQQETESDIDVAENTQFNTDTENAGINKEDLQIDASDKQQGNDIETPENAMPIDMDDTERIALLEEYARNLPECDLDGVQYGYTVINIDYEHKTTYWDSDGLKGYSGCVGWDIRDFDKDNQSELLVFCLEEKDSNVFTIEIYEEDKGLVVLADSMEAISLCLRQDLEENRFYIVDDYYIGISSVGLNFIYADGACYVDYLAYYDGQKIQKVLYNNEQGSDLWQCGKLDTEYIAALTNVGLSRTANNIYNYDLFGSIMSEEKIETLFKISVTNSYLYIEDTPLATCHYIEPSKNDFVLPESHMRYLNESELAGLTKDQLRIARNEIFARYGRPFKDEQLQNYFGDKAWYACCYACPTMEESMLSDIERENLKLILKAEQAK